MTSEGSALDIEPTAPVVNEVYARLRMEQDARYAQLGYSDSDAILASDLPSDDGVEVSRGRQREGEKMRERVVQKAAQNVAPKGRARSVAPTPTPTPARWVGVGVDDVRKESEGSGAPPRARSRGEPSQAAGGRKAHLSPPPPSRGFMKSPRATARTTAHSQARLAEPFPDTNPYVPAHEDDLPAWNLEPPTPTQASASQTTLKPLAYDDIPMEESVDSSRFSQLDLGTSTEDGTYVSTDISDDPWREDVRANKRKW